MTEHIEKYFLGELSSAEKEILLKKVSEDAALKKEFIEIQNLMGVAAFAPQQHDKEIAKAGLLEFERHISRKESKHRVVKILKYAASVAAIVFATWIVADYYINNSLGSTYTEIEAPQGYNTCIHLADGSTVYLNSRSKLRYPNNFQGGKREVFLDGEAFFSVEKNESKPFIVKTSRYDIKVLGTKFNVLNYSEKAVFETTLLEGSVKVFRANEENKALVLSPNEQVVMKNGKLEKRNLEEQNIALWQSGYFVFDNEPFEDIIQKLELFYDVKFVIRNERALYNRYTGNFDSKDGFITILEAIQKVQKFKFDMSSDNKIIYIN